MPHVDNARRAFVAGADLAAYALVKLSSGKVVANTHAATDDPIGVTEYPVLSGQSVSVRLLTCPGTIEVDAAAAVTLGAAVYAADDGKIQALPATTGTYRRIGTALAAAPAGGGVIEVLPYNYYDTDAVS